MATSSKILRLREIGLPAEKFGLRRPATPALAEVPRGNTCAGVNREIIGYLVRRFGADSLASCLDLPCGEGDFISSLKRYMPRWRIAGADIAQPRGTDHEFRTFDASKADPLPFPGRRFDVVTCISGVMEFDNTLAFFERVRESLADDGIFVVTNDNILTVRDRLLYLVSGRFVQYPFATEPGTPTWKIVPLQNLLRLLGDGGFAIEEHRYVPVRPKDRLWSPLALLIWLFGRLFSTGKDRNCIFDRLSFASLLSRHYILVCRKRVPETRR